MSAMLIATSAILIASATSHGGSSGSGSDCPVSSFGAACLASFVILLVLAVISFALAMTRDWSSKWEPRWAILALILASSSFIPVVAGMIHDCQ